MSTFPYAGDREIMHAFAEGRALKFADGSRLHIRRARSSVGYRTALYIYENLIITEPDNGGMRACLSEGTPNAGMEVINYVANMLGVSGRVTTDMVVVNQNRGSLDQGFPAKALAYFWNGSPVSTKIPFDLIGPLGLLAYRVGVVGIK